MFDPDQTSSFMVGLIDVVNIAGGSPVASATLTWYVRFTGYRQNSAL